MNKGLFLRLAFLAAAIPCLAADKPPHIGYVFPAGGKQGTTITVKIGGENVYGASAALVSGAGVAVEVVDSKDPDAGVEFKKKKNKKKNEAVIDEVVTLKVTVSPDADPGNRDICLVMTNALSNKLTFQVGQLNEVLETEPNNKPKVASLLPPLPVLVNGVIMPGDTDTFKFTASKGQHLVIEAAARALLPYIADGVPGWFQAIIAIQDPAGHPVALANDFLFNQDPVLFYDVPSDGEYALTIRDAIYRGREDFVYRLKIGELPFVTGVFPLGAPRGDTPIRVKLSGVNLPDDKMTVDVGATASAVQSLVVTNKGLVSNPFLFALSDLPEKVETKPALTASKARKVTLPVILNGCVGAPGEKHYICFDGKKGESVCLDVHARRLGTPLDSMVTLMDDRGKVLAENDDLKDRGEGYITHQADSGLITNLQETGVYTVMITDKQGRGGSAYSYRLRISEPMPDFDLRVTPAAVFVPAGGVATLTIHAIRRDNFAGAITVALEDALPGLSLAGAVIPAGADKITMTLSSAGRSAGKYSLRLTGKADVAGRPLVRRAVPAENLMQAFLYQHLLAFREQTVLVTKSEAPYSVVPKPSSAVLALVPGQETIVPVSVRRRPGYEGQIRLQLVEPPKGISLRKGNIPVGRDNGVIILFADSKIDTALCGNLILGASMPIERDATPEEIAKRQAQAAKKRETVKGETGNKVPAGNTSGPMKITRPVTVSLPALSFKVVGKAPSKAGAGGITLP